MKRKWSEVVKSIPGWTDKENPYRLSRGHIYIYIYICMSSSWYNILTISSSVPLWSEFTGWAIIEELSKRWRLWIWTHISDQLWTENACETLLCWFIVMIRALVSDNMYRYGRHFRSFYRNPTILETVSLGGFDCLGHHGEFFLSKYNNMK